ncbi:hypothetical protein D3C86_2168110 [compost metagenome]
MMSAAVLSSETDDADCSTSSSMASDGVMNGVTDRDTPTSWRTMVWKGSLAGVEPLVVCPVTKGTFWPTTMDAGSRLSVSS